MKSLIKGPFFPAPKIDVISLTTRRQESIDVKRPKIIVGISISLPGEDAYDKKMRVFPAVLDTGCNGSFLLDERHLSIWAGYIKTIDNLIERRHRPKNRSFEIRAARLWLHLNPYVSPKFQGPIPPYPLTATDQIMVMDKATSDPDPRYPLLGLDALCENNLKLFVDGYLSEFEIFEM